MTHHDPVAEYNRGLVDEFRTNQGRVGGQFEGARGRHDHVTARVADGTEREQIWAAQKIAAPGIAEYETKTDRVMPVVILEPR